VIAAVIVLLGLGFWWWGRVPQAVRDGAPSWSPDSRRIVFAAERGGQSDIYVMNADGTGRRRLTRSTADDSAPAFSPDGSRIAFESARGGSLDIYVMSAAGKDPRRLTTSPSSDRTPAWSPDGASIAFTSDRDPRRQPDVYILPAAGGTPARLTLSDQNWSPQYAPDGHALAVQVNRDIEVFDLRTHAVQRLTYDPDNGMSPTWSPDSQRLAFTTSRSGRLELYTMKADGTDQKPLASMAGGDTIDPRWSPDGTRVAFVYVPHLTDPPGGVQPYAIYTIEIASGKITRLSP
jgi:Tol biopolymer transport system component